MSAREMHAKMAAPVMMASISTPVYVHSDSQGSLVNLVSSLILHAVAEGNCYSSLGKD